jgi:hypothetical protein
VAEHHERLDGSGYPHALQRDAVSPLGRMLAVAEAALAALRSQPQPSLARASVALRVVPGEFDLSGSAASPPPRAPSPALPAGDHDRRREAAPGAAGRRLLSAQDLRQCAGGQRRDRRR